MLFLYDSRVAYITNNDTWLHHRVEHLPWVSCTLFKEYELFIKDGFLCFPWTGTPDEEDVVYQHLFNFDIWNGITIYEPFKEGINVWGFASSRSYNNLELYFNKRELFTRWILAFKTTPAYQGRFLYAPPTHLNDLELQKLKTPPSHPENIEKHKKKRTKFCVTLGHKEIEITPKELECLLLITKGFTAKHIAHSLNIVPKTVEAHIHHMKEKLGADFSSSLVESFMENSFNTLL